MSLNEKIMSRVTPALKADIETLVRDTEIRKSEIIRQALKIGVKELRTRLVGEQVAEKAAA